MNLFNSNKLNFNNLIAPLKQKFGVMCPENMIYFKTRYSICANNCEF